MTWWPELVQHLTAPSPHCHHCGHAIESHTTGFAQDACIWCDCSPAQRLRNRLRKR